MVFLAEFVFLAVDNLLVEVLGVAVVVAIVPEPAGLVGERPGDAVDMAFAEVWRWLEDKE